MEERKRNKLILLIARCIEATFSESDWDELVYLTDGKEIIYGHPRLLRSLSFGDNDYRSNIFSVIESLFSKDSANIGIITTQIKLTEWLKENYPKDFEELFGHTGSLLNEIEQTAITNSIVLTQHLIRIRGAIVTDPELAIGSTKELLESVMKTILLGMGEGEGDDNNELPALLKKTQGVLNLDPKKIDPQSKGAEITKIMLGNLGHVIVAVNELRNIYGTGHGKTHGSKISSRHARLVVGAGATLATFLMETYEEQKPQEDIPF